MSEYTSPTPVEGFLDPDDPILFPRLTAAQIEKLAESAETISLSPGEIVLKQGQRNAPLYVVLSGAIDVIDRQPEGDRYFTQCQPGTFAADTSMFTGEPTIARGVAAEETTVLALPPDALRALVAGSAELGDLLLRTMVIRREWLRGQGLGYERLIGRRRSGEAFAIRELLERNLIPFGWHDIDADAESQALLERLGIGPEECPVLVRTHNVLRRPTVTQVADEFGLRAQVDRLGGRRARHAFSRAQRGVGGRGQDHLRRRRARRASRAPRCPGHRARADRDLLERHPPRERPRSGRERDRVCRAARRRERGGSPGRNGGLVIGSGPAKEAAMTATILCTSVSPDGCIAGPEPGDRMPSRHTLDPSGRRPCCQGVAGEIEPERGDRGRDGAGEGRRLFRHAGLADPVEGRSGNRHPGAHARNRVRL
jgi:CRP-like cAMP-binding protein